MQPAPKAGVQSVTDNTMVSVGGTIEFTITNNKEENTHNPSRWRDIITKVSQEPHFCLQMVKQKGNAYGVLAHGKFSNFMWDDDKK